MSSLVAQAPSSRVPSPRVLISRVKSRDPEWTAFHRALRVAVVIPGTFAFSWEVIANPQVATFTAFGGLALLLFVDFPGDRPARLTSYAMLAVAGAVLISLGTLASRATWLAVLSMAVVAFAVLFAGTLSASIAAGGRATLLLFILPVTQPGTAGDIPARLGGWGIAVAAAVPAVMLAWPPVEHDNLRRFAADTCEAIAAVIKSRGAGQGEPSDAQCQRVSESLTALRRAFRSTTSRPVGITTGSRLLIRLVDELEWLGSVTAALRTEQMQTWPDLSREAAEAGADVLLACAEQLRAGRRPGAREQTLLNEALIGLAERRQAVRLAIGELLMSRPGSGVAWPYEGHELAYAASLVGITVQWAGEADTRPVLDRFFGRQVQHEGRAPLSPAVEIAASQVTSHSVWLQNAVRGALGLGLAVLIAKLTGTQHAFWVVLGALSVLRSNALSTGSTVLRALFGTLAGFVVGALVVLAVGSNTAALWAVLPFAFFLAALAPQVISFAAGQAGFTVVLLILFNIIAPVGWKVGLVRIEDIALGCAASLVVGVVAWPRGAGAAIRTALSQAYRVGAVYLEGVVLATMWRESVPSAELADVLAAGRRLDDAFRQYLAEGGAKTVPLQDLTAAANGATRLRLAGEAIASLRPPEAGQPLGPGSLSASAELVRHEVAAVRDYYSAVADLLGPHPTGDRFPQSITADGACEVVESVRRDLTADGAGVTEPDLAGQLVWTALYVEDMQVHESRLTAQLARSPLILAGAGSSSLTPTRATTLREALITMTVPRRRQP